MQKPKYYLRTSRSNAILWAGWSFGVQNAKRIVDGFEQTAANVLIPCELDHRSATFTKRQAIEERERFMTVVAWLKGRLCHNAVFIDVQVVKEVK